MSKALVDGLKQRRAELRAERSRQAEEFARVSADLDGRLDEIETMIDRLSRSPAAIPFPAAPRHRQPAGAVRAAILDKLSGDFGSMTVEELVAATKHKAPSVRAALKALDAEGKVSASGDGWMLTASEHARQKAGKANGSHADTASVEV